MAKEIKIPQISEGVETATISEILVSKGDKIDEDQSVVAVETDKATADVPSTYSGIVKEIKVKEGQEVNVGDTVILLEEEEGEESKEKTSSEKSSDSEGEKNAKDQNESKTEEETKSQKDQGKETKSKSTEKKSDTQNDKESSSSKEVYASPGVRRMARESGVDLQDLQGSGAEGRITENDIKNYQKEDRKETSTHEHLKLPDFSKWGAVEREELNNIKKTTAKNVTESWQSIPHVFQFGEADISNIEDYIEKHEEDIEKAGGKLTLTGILTKIIATALHQFPTFNASVDMENDKIILKRYINISIAVATDKGLLVPVIKDADQKSMKELSVEISEVAEKARDQKLTKEDMDGGNFSISNLGGIGGTNFTPIVYHPQVAILGVSQASIKPVYIDGEFEARKILPLSLSYDHRVIDGADGAEFMDWIVKALEDPYEALLH